jgi:hypothetical protein
MESHPGCAANAEGWLFPFIDQSLPLGLDWKGSVVVDCVCFSVRLLL